MTVQEREEYLDSVEGLLGLRGHLLDEIIRIQEMLAEDDPDLDVNTHRYLITIVSPNIII